MMDIWLKINLTMLVLFVVFLFLGCKRGAKYNIYDHLNVIVLALSLVSWPLYVIGEIWL